MENRSVHRKHKFRCVKNTQERQPDFYMNLHIPCNMSIDINVFIDLNTTTVNNKTNKYTLAMTL